MAQCQFVKTNGHRCRSPTLTGSKLCFFHDPSQATKRRQAQRAGGVASSQGRSRWRWQPVEPLDLDTIEQVMQLVREQLNELRGLQPSPRKATAIFYGIGLLVKLYELCSFEQRLGEMERIFNVEVVGWKLSQPWLE